MCKNNDTVFSFDRFLKSITGLLRVPISAICIGIQENTPDSELIKILVVIGLVHGGCIEHHICYRAQIVFVKLFVGKCCIAIPIIVMISDHLIVGYSQLSKSFDDMCSSARSDFLCCIALRNIAQAGDKVKIYFLANSFKLAMQ